MRKALPDIAKDAHQAEMSNKTPVFAATQSTGSSRFLKANTRKQRCGCNVEPAAVVREALRQKCRYLAVANVPRVCILDPDWENPDWENTEDR